MKKILIKKFEGFVFSLKASVSEKGWVLFIFF